MSKKIKQKSDIGLLEILQAIEKDKFPKVLRKIALVSEDGHIEAFVNAVTLMVSNGVDLEMAIEVAYANIAGR